jgi:hypothetical protein
MKSSQDALRCRSPGVVDWKQTIRRAIAKFAVLLLLSSVALPATAFRGSHSSARSHSRSSYHVRSYKGSHRTRRAKSSAVSRNTHGFPHPRYRIIFIGGRNRGAEILKAPSAPIAQALHSPTERRAHTGKRMRRGARFLHGAGRSESWAPHDLRSAQAHRRLYSVPTGPPSHFPPSAFLTLGTASSLSGGRNRGAEILKAPPTPSPMLCTRPHRVAGPQRKSDEVRGGGSCTGGTDGEEAADGGKSEGVPASGGGWESVHRTTLATLDEQSGRQVGPTILVDRPWPGTPAPHR